MQRSLDIKMIKKFLTLYYSLLIAIFSTNFPFCCIPSDGKSSAPTILSHEFAGAAENAGWQNVGFHDFRHTFTSLMFLRGAKPRAINEALRHSGAGFTMDVYSHIIEAKGHHGIA